MDKEHHQVEKILHDNVHSTTLFKEIKCSCQWTIYNFSFFAQGDKSSVAPNYAPDIESPLFKYGCNNDLIWDINIVNLRNIEEEYLKVYVYVNDSEWHDYLSLDVKLSILDGDGKEAYTIKCKPNILSTEAVNFIKRDYLMDKNKGLLTDDKLVILCEINASAEVYTYSWDADDDEDYQNVDKECTADIFRSRIKVSQDLQDLLQSNIHDATVVMKKKQFCLHKCVLAARSRIFSAMFERDMLEQANNSVTITDISSKTFESVVEFLYSGTISNVNDIHNSLLLEILTAADKYELNELKEICECIYSTKLLTSNAIELLNLADRFHAEKLKKFITQFIVAHENIMSDPAFEALLNTHPHLAPCILEEKSEESAEDSLDLLDNSNDQGDTRNNCINHIHLPQIKSPLEGKQWSVTRICKDKGTCIWKINQINFLSNRDTGDYIISDKFTKDKIGLSWQLYLYLKGVNNDTKDFVSLHIKFFNGSTCTHKMQAQYEFAILNAKGETVNPAKSDLLSFTINQSELGETRFIKRDLLFNKKKNYLQDNTLVIVCTVTFGLNSQLRFYQSNLLDYCEHKFLLAVSDDFERLLESGKHSDITLSVGEKEFLVHRAILSVRCPTLLNIIDELFEKQQKKSAELYHVDSQVFKEILSFIYSGKVNHLKTLTKSLYAEATRLSLEGLRSICEIYLCKNLTIENVCDNFVFAHINNARRLRVKCSLFITDNLRAVINTAGYKSMAESRPRLLKDLVLHRHHS